MVFAEKFLNLAEKTFLGKFNILNTLVEGICAYVHNQYRWEFRGEKTFYQIICKVA